MEVRRDDGFTQPYILNCTRDFLLFLPTHSPNLKVVLSYYSSAISVNPEGDVHVSGGGATGLGINFLFSCLFGVIFEIANYRLRKPAPESDYSQPTINTTFPTTSEPNTFPWDPGEDSLATMPKPRETEAAVAKPRVHSLTTLLPESGYFLAGAAAGCVSRTATAPLDRLKVYLIAQTNITKEAVDAVKTGAPIEAAKKAGRPLVEATLALWRMGGIRSLFAGQSLDESHLVALLLTSLGNGLNVLKVMPESAIKFGSYEVCPCANVIEDSL